MNFRSPRYGFKKWGGLCLLWGGNTLILAGFRSDEVTSWVSENGSIYIAFYVFWCNLRVEGCCVDACHGWSSNHGGFGKRIAEIFGGFTTMSHTCSVRLRQRTQRIATNFSTWVGEQVLRMWNIKLFMSSTVLRTVLMMCHKEAFSQTGSTLQQPTKAWWYVSGQFPHDAQVMGHCTPLVESLCLAGRDSRDILHKKIFIFWNRFKSLMEFKLPLTRKVVLSIKVSIAWK